MKGSCTHCGVCGESYTFRGEHQTAVGARILGRLPLILGCGHSFCLPCLSQLAKKTPGILTCPQTGCTRVTLIKDNDLMKSLSIDVYIIGLLALEKKDSHLGQHLNKLKTAAFSFTAPPQAAAEESPSRKSEVVKCNECTKAPATCRCLKCEEEAMCDACFNRIHQASRLLRKHQAVPLYESDLENQIVSVCKDHDGRPLEYFCEDDQTAICSHCVIGGEHQNHNISAMEEKHELKLLLRLMRRTGLSPQAFKRYMKSNKKALNELEPVFQESQLVLRCLRNSHHLVKTVMPDVKQEIQMMTDDIRNQFHRLHTMLQAREEAILKELASTGNHDLGPVTELKNKLEQGMENIRRMVRDAKKAQVSSTHMIVNVQTILDRLRQANEMPCILQVSKSDSKMRFSLDEEEYAEVVSRCGKLEGSSPVQLSLLSVADAPAELLEERGGLPTSDNNVAADSSSREPSEYGSYTTITNTDATSEAGVSELDTASVDTEASRSTQNKPSGPFIADTELKTGGAKDLVYVTHIRNPCCFAVQRCADTNRFQQLAQTINKHCNQPKTDKQVPTSLSPGDFVLTQYSADGRWYRGMIRHCENSDDPMKSKAQVYYLDYGNQEERTYDRLRKITKSQMKLPAMAVRCSLYDIGPASQDDHWTTEAGVAFGKMTGDKPMVCRVITFKDGVYFVDLAKPPVSDDIKDDRPVSMRDALVFLEYAILKSEHTSPLYPGGPIPKPAQQYLTPAPPRRGDTINVLLSHADSPDDFHVQQIGIEAHSLSQMMMELQNVYNTDRGDLWNIFCPHKDQICVAKYSVDQYWYRAQVVQLPGRRNIVVRYVDFGNTEVVSYTALRKIHQRFLVLPAQAIHCGLADVESSVESGWSPQALQIFTQICGRAVVAKVIGVADGCVKVVLYDVSSDQQICLNSLLVEEGVAKSTGPGSAPHEFPQDLQFIPERLVHTSPPDRPKERSDPNPEASMRPRQLLKRVPTQTQSEKPVATSSPLRPGKAKKKKRKEEEEEGAPKLPRVVVSCVRSPGSIFIQTTTASSDGLDQLMADLQVAYHGRPNVLRTWTEGDHCVALNSNDNHWYRAKIISTPAQDIMEVLMFDFGFMDTLPDSHLRPLDKEHLVLATFSMQCHLSGIQPAGDITRWSRTSCEYLMEYLKGKTCYLDIKGDQEMDSLPVDIVVREEKKGDALNPDIVEFNSVSRQLLQEGLALPLRKGRLTPRAVNFEVTDITVAPQPDTVRPMSLKSLSCDTSQEPPVDIPPVCEIKVEGTEETSIHSKPEGKQSPAEDDGSGDATKSGSPEEASDVIKLDESSHEVSPVSVLEGSSDTLIADKSDVQEETEAAAEEDESQVESQVTDECVEISEDEKSGAHVKLKTPVTPPKPQQQQRQEAKTEAIQAVAEDEEVSPNRSLDEKSKLDAEISERIAVSRRPISVQMDPSVDYSPVRTPKSDEFLAVPSYVDYDCIVYIQEIPKASQREGCYGYLLREYSLETIIQDKFLAGNNLSRAYIPRDGNCLFRAFSEAVFGDQTQQHELRLTVVAHLRANWDQFKAVIGETNAERYLVAMSKDGTYGGEPEIKALCMLNNVKAKVYLGGLKYPVQSRLYEAGTSDGAMVISLIYISDGFYDNGHYDVVTDDPAKVTVCEEIYEKWREIRIPQLEGWGGDQSTYELSLLEQIDNYLQDFYGHTLPEPGLKRDDIRIGQPVIVKYLLDDKYYRARTIQATERGFKVFYVDFGNCEDLPLDRIRTNVELKAIPEQCIGCVIHGIKPRTVQGKWPVPHLDYIHKLIVGQRCTVTVKGRTGPGNKYLLVSVKLSDGEDLAQHLMEKGYAWDESYTFSWAEICSSESDSEDEENQQLPPALTFQQKSPHPPPLGVSLAEAAAAVDDIPDEMLNDIVDAVTVRKVPSPYKKMKQPRVGDIVVASVTQVNAPDQVYLQHVAQDQATDPWLVGINDELDQLLEVARTLNSCASSFPPLTDIRPGRAACVQFSADDCWYRGEVVMLHHTGDTMMVGMLFVDYGNSEFVHPSKLRQLPDEFLDLPVQAFQCRLAGIAMPDGVSEWPITTTVAMTEILANKYLIAAIRCVEPEQVYVDLYDREMIQECQTLDEMPLVYQPLLDKKWIQIQSHITEDGTLIEEGDSSEGDEDFEDAVAPQDSSPDKLGRCSMKSKSAARTENDTGSMSDMD